MKTITRITKTLLVALILTSFVRNVEASGNRLSFTAELRSENEVPPISSDAYGVAMFSFNAGMDTLFLDVQASNLSGPVTGAHIHKGMTGENGNVVIGLDNYFDGNVATGVITGNDLSGIDISTLVKGGYYVNVHTSDNPGGEVRGQLNLEQDLVITSWLSGTNEVPSVSGNAYGLLTARLSRDHSKLHIRASFSEMTGAVTGAHLHEADANSNGGVVLNLSDSVNGNMLVATVDPSSILTALMENRIYLNVHTSANAGGEIRGQLVMNGNIGFDTWLNGDQEVPPLSSSAWGHASIQLTPGLDTLWYHVVLHDLSGPVTGIHLHMAEAGMNGSVVLNMSSDVMDSMVVGYTTDLTPDWVEAMIKQEIYVNVHTANNPGGEVRGQLWPSVRNTYFIGLSGDNLVPAITVDAKGKGFVSVSSDGNDAFVAAVVDDLTGPVTGAHFHMAKIGANGNVLVDLSSDFLKVTSWDMVSVDLNTSNGWDPMYASAMSQGEVYLNIHTVSNPNGEARGQAQDQQMYKTTASVADLKNAGNVDVYPNPATTDMITVELINENSTNYTIRVLDLAGRVVKYVDSANDGETRGSTQINVSDLPKGMYSLEIVQEGVKGSAKFAILK